MAEELNVGLPAPTPSTTLETEAFWKATADDQLLLKHCTACDSHYYYPRHHCPECAGTETEWVEASGAGTIYSYTITRQIGISEGGYDEATPFVLAYVQLEEGPYMLTNIIDTDSESLEIGEPVEVAFSETDGESDIKLPRFRPVKAED